ncbi:MAG: hypothetical protein JRI23_01345 [Deltaproteobacteria bacterium]|jgi:hypothetical protein|nr:hypothetical protein [Deltaproteobacteria bacterium]MBW2530106.1 hypothetical protein [Deltaproteobacteria bacterium]
MAQFVDRQHRIGCDQERAAYLECLGAAIVRTDWRLISYAVMSSHVHWLAIAGASPFHRLAKCVHSGFASWLNRRQHRRGPVFADRPKSKQVEQIAAPLVMAYQHNNPVRAGIAQRAADCDWTSHRCYLGLAPVPDWLDVGAGLQMSGYDDDAEGRRGFDRYVVARSEEPVDVCLSGGDLKRAQREARKVTRRPAEVGYPALADGTLVFPITAGADGVRYSIEEIVEIVSEQSGVAASEIRKPSRRARTVEARQLTVLVARQLGATQREIGHELNLSREGVSHAERRAKASAIEAARKISEQIVSGGRAQLSLPTCIRQLA